jgi:type II secretory pathway pseudopilin PulG
MSWRQVARDERGFTLVELLVATIAGLVVSAAALAIVVSSLSFASGDADRIDSNQQGGVAMERIVQALDSSCVAGYGISPIVGVTGTSAATGSTGAPPSSSNTLTFFSALTDSPIVTPNEVSVYFNSTTGSLMMATYGPTGPSGYYPPTPSSTLTLIQNAAPPGSTATQNSTTPLFTYYGYDISAGTLTDQYTPSPLTAPLGATDAALTSEVGISFQAQPSDGNDSVGDSVDLSNSVVLRLTAVANGATGTYANGVTGSTGSTTPQPCE